MSRWDIDALVTDVAHDIEWQLPETLSWGGTRHGRDGIEAMATRFEDVAEAPWVDYGPKGRRFKSSRPD